MKTCKVHEVGTETFFWQVLPRSSLSLHKKNVHSAMVTFFVSMNCSYCALWVCCSLSPRRIHRFWQSKQSRQQCGRCGPKESRREEMILHKKMWWWMMMVMIVVMLMVINVGQRSHIHNLMFFPLQEVCSTAGAWATVRIVTCHRTTVPPSTVPPYHGTTVPPYHRTVPGFTCTHL